MTDSELLESAAKAAGLEYTGEHYAGRSMNFEDWADRNGIFGASVPVHLFRQCWEAAQKGALGEPVAWMVVDNDGQDCFVTADPNIAEHGQRALPLYTGARCSNENGY